MKSIATAAVALIISSASAAHAGEMYFMSGTSCEAGFGQPTQNIDVYRDYQGSFNDNASSFRFFMCPISIHPPTDTLIFNGIAAVTFVDNSPTFNLPCTPYQQFTGSSVVLGVTKQSASASFTGTSFYSWSPQEVGFGFASAANTGIRCDIPPKANGNRSGVGMYWVQK